MNVALIGFSHSGKTSYTAAMYDGFFGDDVKGFSIVAESCSDSSELLLIAKDIKNGKYPLGTIKQEIYDFTLKYEGHELTSFRWIDYCGGTLDAISNGAYEEEYDELMEFVFEASALIFLFDASSFLGPLGSELDEQLRFANALIQQVSAARKEKTKLPVSFVLTKFDKCEKIEGGGVDAILESTPGKTLTRILEDIEKSKVICGLLTGTIAGINSNVQYPLMMSMCLPLQEECIRLKREAEKAQEEGDRHASERCITDEIWGFITDDATHRELAEWSYDAAKQASERYERILAAINKLSEVLVDANNKYIRLYFSKEG